MDVKLLDIKEVAEILQEKEETCRTWVKRGVIPKEIILKLGSRIRIPETLFEKWLLKQM